MSRCKFVLGKKSEFSHTCVLATTLKMCNKNNNVMQHNVPCPEQEGQWNLTSSPPRMNKFLRNKDFGP